MDRQQMIADLKLKRQAAKNDIDALIARAQSFGRDLSAGERQTFSTKETEVKGFTERVEELERQQRMDDASAPMARKYNAPRYGEGVTHNESVYTPRNDGASFFRDLHRASTKGDFDAADRLRRNNAQVAAEKRAISTTNGAGGEFVPPLWLESQFVALARPGRITADLCFQQDLPAGTDVINIPKVNTGTAVAPQSAQNTGIQQTDVTTTSVSSPVVTIAGGQTVSLQLLEQSPINIDNVILADLAADYAMKLDQQVIAGSGTGGTLTGINTLAGTNSIAFTTTTPTLSGAGGLYNGLANAIQQIHTKRFLPPDVIVMHPRRWAWVESQYDSTNRPMVVPRANGPYNGFGVQTDAVAQGVAGQIMGLDVVLDANLPVNLGTGTNQDIILVMRASDLFLWESHIRAEAFQQTYAQNMSVFVRLYNYCAFQAGRYPQSISTISGTGLVTPTF